MFRKKCFEDSDFTSLIVVTNVIYIILNKMTYIDQYTFFNKFTQIFYNVHHYQSINSASISMFNLCQYSRHSVCVYRYNTGKLLFLFSVYLKIICKVNPMSPELIELLKHVTGCFRQAIWSSVSYVSICKQIIKINSKL